MDLTTFISQSRSSLQISDHSTYRSQLTRRILTLRKRLGIATPKREKYSPKAISAEDVKKNIEFLHLLVLGVERSWAHAMVLKNEGLARVQGGEGGVRGRTRGEVLSKLRKAGRQAEEVVKIFREVSAEKEQVLEARAYAAGMKGSEEFERLAEGGGGSGEVEDGEKRGWEGCLRAWSEVRVIYAALLTKAGGEGAAKGEVFREVLASTVDPTIRYAAYQARLSRSIPIPAVAKKYFPRDDGELVKSVEALDQWALKEKPKAEEGQAKTVDAAQEVPNSVTWRGRKANIVDASIGQALASVTAAEARLKAYLAEHPSASARDKAAAYDDILIASQDAADAAKRATDELEKERIDEGDARMQDLRVTSLAVNYDLVSWRVGRNRVLIGSDDGLTLPSQTARKPTRTRKDGTPYPDVEEPRSRKLARLRERVVLYDATLQSITSVKELRGAMRDDDFVRELDGKGAYFRALKCVNIALSHALLGNHLNALALLQRASSLLSSSKPPSSEPTDPSSPPTLALSSTSVSALQKHVTSSLARTHALVELRKLESNAAIAASKNMVSAAPIVQDLSAYPTPGSLVDVKNLVSYPPSVQPVPVKPLFLDVAWNYVDYPGRGGASGTESVAKKVAEKMEGVVEEGKKEPEKKKGWFGFGR